MKKTLFYIIFCIVAINTFSQEIYTAFGLRGAIGISKFSGMKGYETAGIIPGSYFTTTGPYSSTIFPAWDLGLTVQHGRNNFVIQGDLLISYLNTGLKNAYIDKDEKLKRIRAYYTNLTINFGTKWLINDNARLIAGLGPYIGFDATGWLTGRSNNYGIDGGGYSLPDEGVLDTEEADYKTFDFGGSILLGMEYKNYQFALNYYHGLYNVVKDDSSLYNRALKLSVVYFF